MTDTQHVRPEDLSLHAMRLLDARDAAATQAHLAECAECRRAYNQAQDDLALVALTVELASPRPQARQRFLDQVAQEKRAPTPQLAAVPSAQPLSITDAPQRKRSSGSLLPWLGWAVAAGATFFAFSSYHDRKEMQATIAQQSAQLRTETTQMAALSADAVKARELMEALTASSVMRVTLNTTPAAKAAPQGHTNYVPEKGLLIFTANNLEPLPLQKIYELWIIPQDGSSPVPAGTFAPDARGNASVIMPEIPKGVVAKAFGVTLEADGGSTKPTLPILLAGA